MPTARLRTSGSSLQPGTPINQYSEISSLASGIQTTILSYSVPVGETFYLQGVEASGTNIAEYSVLVGPSVIGKQRTYFGGGLNVFFEFGIEGQLGVPISSGSVLVVSVIHFRTSTGNFGARILGLQQP